MVGRNQVKGRKQIDIIEGEIWINPSPRLEGLDSFRSAVYQELMGRMRRPPRAKRPRKAPAKPGSLRIQLLGTRTPDELRDMLRQAVDKIEELGITHARGVNLYISPLDANGGHVTPVANGQKISSVTIEAPYKSAADEYGL